MGGGSNCLFGTEVLIPLFRGNRSVVEVSSENTNPTKLPDVEPLQAGTMDNTTRCFDLLCFGKCDLTSTTPKLNVKPADKIPNLITKNKDGTVVFTEPAYMCTIQAPKGQNVWVSVELKTISTKASEYMCLGIKKRGESDYFDMLSANNTSRYVDVLETDTVELIPLVSSTKLPTYTAVKAGEEARLDGATAADLDFGSVYRVQITLHDSQWLTEQACDLYKICNGWVNEGKVGIGSVVHNGVLYNNQLVEINNWTGQLAHSSDGIHWKEIQGVAKEDEKLVSGIGGNIWGFGPVYGNGIWCAVSWSEVHGIRRSVDQGENWSGTLKDIATYALEFGNGIFMTVAPSGSVYTSADAETWIQTSTLPNMESDYGYRTLIYGNGEWVCGTFRGEIYKSKDEGRTWQYFTSNLVDTTNAKNIVGGIYVNGYFYVISYSGGIARSSDGIKWTKLTDFSGYSNTTYYKDKLYMFNKIGTKFCVGLFRPDGTIDPLL